VFAMDETFSSSRGSRLDQLRNALEFDDYHAASACSRTEKL
jgi:hypothetical protein